MMHSLSIPISRLPIVMPLSGTFQCYLEGNPLSSAIAKQRVFYALSLGVVSMSYENEDFILTFDTQENLTKYIMLHG